MHCIAVIHAHKDMHTNLYIHTHIWEWKTIERGIFPSLMKQRPHWIGAPQRTTCYVNVQQLIQVVNEAYPILIAYDIWVSKRALTKHTNKTDLSGSVGFYISKSDLSLDLDLSWRTQTSSTQLISVVQFLSYVLAQRTATRPPSTSVDMLEVLYLYSEHILTNVNLWSSIYSINLDELKQEDVQPDITTISELLHSDLSEK